MSKKTFKENMDQLDEIINKLESGDLDLDEALLMYKQGLKLSKELESKLKDVQEQLRELNNHEC